MPENVDVQYTINAPQNKVYQAIIKPEELTGYFASKASGELVEDKKVTWTFDDVGAELEINVKKIVADHSISFEWGASGKQTSVNILIESQGDELSRIRIVEKEFEMNAEDVQRAMQQTQGWTDFICSLKAYLYTGINLRK